VTTTPIPELPQTITIALYDLPPDAKPLEMVLIPAGTYLMGSPENEKDRISDEGPQHQVTISQPFYMGIYEVTNGQWKAVMGTSPSGEMNRPAQQVSWNDCQTFIQQLNMMGQGSFRLPTEAEWEYACRAGTTTRFHWGDDLNYTQIGNYEWYQDNSNMQTQEVGLKQPNGWGLYDMSGNVLEWCQDSYGAYPSDPQTDPLGSINSNSKVLRGGGWGFIASYCRSAVRAYTSKESGDSGIGLRLIRTP